jgi:hypothetical protein
MLFDKPKYLYYLSTLLLMSTSTVAAENPDDDEEMRQVIALSLQTAKFEDEIRTQRAQAKAQAREAKVEEKEKKLTQEEEDMDSLLDMMLGMPGASKEAAKRSAFSPSTLTLSAQLTPEQKEKAPVPEPLHAHVQAGDVRIVEQPRELKAAVQRDQLPVVITPKLAELVRYILGYRYEVRTYFGNMMDPLSFIEQPMCMGADPTYGLATNLLESCIKEKLTSFKAYCVDKQYDYEAALPLFDHLFKRYIAGEVAFHKFLESYNKIYAFLTSDASPVKPLIAAKVFGPEGDQAFVEGMQRIGLAQMYGNLKTEYAGITAILKNLTSDIFLSTVPQEDLDRLTTGQKGPVKVENTEKKVEMPRFVDRSAMPLDKAILDYQQEIGGVFQRKMQEMNELVAKYEKDKQQGAMTAQRCRELSDAALNESVMAFGQIVARDHYKRVDRAINNMWAIFKDKLPAPITKIDQLVAFYQTILKDLGHTQFDVKKVEEALKHSAPTNNANQFDINILKDIRPHDYLFMVFSHIYRFYHMVKPHNPDKANVLMGIFFNALIEQGTHCQAGCVGRIHVPHKETLDMMIDYYYHTPINK